MKGMTKTEHDVFLYHHTLRNQISRNKRKLQIINNRLKFLIEEAENTKWANKLYAKLNYLKKKEKVS